MQNNKIVPIIIITYNKLYKFTIPCIDSIISNTCYPYKIIVLDNGSTDDTVNILKEKYQHTGLIDILESKENHHWHGGNIKALEFVREKYNYDYFCLLNSDTLVSEGWLTKLTKHLTKNPNSISIVPTETIYKISILKKFYNEKKINLLTFPAYCPNLNIVEYCFSILKKPFYQSIFKSK